MAGVLGQINNNLVGLQQLAQGRQELEQRNKLIEDERLATDYLRKFQTSSQEGNPDYASLNEAIIRSPQLSKNVLDGIGIREKRQGQDAASFISQAASVANDPNRFMQLAQARVNYLQQNGRDPSDTMQLIETYQANPGQAMKDLQGVGAALANQGYLDKDLYSQLFGVGTTGGAKEFEALTKGLSPEEKEAARRIELGLAPRAVGSSAITIASQGLTNPVAASQSTIAGAIEGGKTQADIDARIAGGGRAEETEAAGSAKGKASTERRELFKTQGLAAAENIPTLRRAIELQDEILSGGGANALRKMANYLGVASQDEGELNSLFGQNILGQLKATFGGSPTEGEREALAQAQASFNQTGKINSKLLRNALKLASEKVARGKRAAQADKDDATIDEIDAALSISLGDDVFGGSGKSGTAPGINGETKIGRFTVKVN